MFSSRATTIAAVLLSLGAGVRAGQAAEPVHAKVVLVYTALDHPWASHMYEHECKLLAHCLEQTDGVEASVVQSWPDERQLDQVRSIVFYSSPAGDIALNPDHRQQFLRLMKDGVGFAAIHWATGTDAKLGDEYANILGGWFNFAHAGLKVDTQLLTQQDPDHPVCRGWKPYQLHDEFYLNMKLHGQTKPLLKVLVDGKEQVVAWTYERANSHGGRSFGTTLGHFHENFALPEFRRAIINGILWTAHVDIPEKGASVDVTEKVLDLPQQK